MEGSSGNPFEFTVPNPPEWEKLQKEHDEKKLKIQELKSQIQSVKFQLEKTRKVPEDKKAVFKSLSEKYEAMREEYNTLFAEKSKERMNHAEKSKGKNKPSS